MESVPDEVLMAYADDTLAPDERTHVATLLTSDPLLRRKMEELVVARVALREIFGPIARAPVPERLVAVVESAGAPPDRFSPAMRSRGPRAAILAIGEAIYSFRGTTLVPIAALSAAVIIVAVWMLSRQTAESPLVEAGLIAMDSNGPFAAGELVRTLDTSRSGHLSGGQESITPILSFRSRDSRYCRQYKIESASVGRVTGLACRDPADGRARGVWRVIAQEQVSPHVGGPDVFRPASGPDAPSIETAVSRLIDGDVLGPNDEADLIGRGWRR